MECGRPDQALQRERLRHLGIMTAHGEEGCDQQRDHEDNDPGAFGELCSRQREHHDRRHDRADTVDPEAPPPPAIPPTEPAPDHACLRQGERHEHADGA